MAPKRIVRGSSTALSFAAATSFNPSPALNVALMTDLVPSNRDLVIEAQLKHDAVNPSMLVDEGYLSAKDDRYLWMTAQDLLGKEVA